MITILLYYLYLNKKWDEIEEPKRFYLFMFFLVLFLALCQILAVPAYGMMIFATLGFLFRIPYLYYFNNKN